MSEKLRVGILGATGMVGQRFITLLSEHPWYEICVLAASSRSAGKTYEEAVGGKWKMDTPMPEKVKNMVVRNIDEVDSIAADVDFVFSAVNMSKEEIRAIEDLYAKSETPVVSNNSAHRWTPDVPMVIPEINCEHFEIIEAQKKRLGTKRGFIAVKPNCSIQSYIACLAAWKEFEPTKVSVCTYQAISGAGKTFADWPEMVGNIIPYIGGEEEKSELEPLKVLGHIEGGEIVRAEAPLISAQCIRVPVLNGHTAAVSVCAVHPRSGPERTYSGRIRELREEADEGRADRPSRELQRKAAGTRTSARTEAVRAVSRGGQPSAGPCRRRFRGRNERIDRPSQRGYDL